MTSTGYRYMLIISLFQSLLGSKVSLSLFRLLNQFYLLKLVHFTFSSLKLRFEIIILIICHCKEVFVFSILLINVLIKNLVMKTSSFNTLAPQSKQKSFITLRVLAFFPWSLSSSVIFILKYSDWFCRKEFKCRCLVIFIRIGYYGCCIASGSRQPVPYLFCL